MPEDFLLLSDLAEKFGTVGAQSGDGVVDVAPDAVEADILVRARPRLPAGPPVI